MLDMKNMRPAIFQIDMPPEVEIDRFVGFHDPAVDWNGFACPYFPWDVADQALEIVVGLVPGSTWFFDKKAREFRIFWPDEDLVVYEANIVEIDGQPVELYPVGAWEWAWSLLADDQDGQFRFKVNDIVRDPKGDCWLVHQLNICVDAVTHDLVGLPPHNHRAGLVIGEDRLEPAKLSTDRTALLPALYLHKENSHE
jgi:hypothetical protein